MSDAGVSLLLHADLQTSQSVVFSLQHLDFLTGLKHNTHEHAETLTSSRWLLSVVMSSCRDLVQVWVVTFSSSNSGGELLSAITRLRHLRADERLQILTPAFTEPDPLLKHTLHLRQSMTKKPQ